MLKDQFIKELEESLRQYPKEEVQDVLNYYDEMITERMEAGNNEEEAIAALGDIKVISTRIKTELIDVKLEEPKRDIAKTSSNFWLVLMLCMSPALIPIGIAFAILFFTIFVTSMSLVFAFGLSSVGLIIGLIPLTISSIADVGITGGIMAAGIILILAGVFALLAYVIGYLGINILNGLLKGTNRLIKRINKRGE